jgi:hypothetical protein
MKLAIIVSKQEALRESLQYSLLRDIITLLQERKLYEAVTERVTLKEMEQTGNDECGHFLLQLVSQLKKTVPLEQTLDLKTATLNVFKILN